jgi:hypothetical protein
MEDLIPLMIIIAISIIGAVTRKKKRINEEVISSPEQHNGRDSEIFKWLEKLGIDDEFSNNDPIEPQNSTIKEPPAPIKAPEKENINNRFSQYGGFITPEEREQLMSKEGISVKKQRKTSNEIATENSNTEDAITENERFIFDLKQAVIFSEILNRKYA